MPVPSARPVAVFHGNCQAEALSLLLAATPAFSENYEVVRIPAVHDIHADRLDEVHAALDQARLFVTQEVRDDYRGMPVGTRQLAERLPSSSRVVRIPALYCDAALPFQVYVRDDAGLPVEAPVSIYHDLRAIHAAVEGLTPEDALAITPRPDGLREIAAAADAHVRRIEAGADVRVADVLARRDRLGSAFLAVNHPTNATLTLLAERLLDHLELSGPIATWPSEILGKVHTPVEPAVVAALGLSDAPSGPWVVDGTTHEAADVLAAHLDLFAARPGLAQTAHRQHEGRLRALGYTAG